MNCIVLREQVNKERMKENSKTRQLQVGCHPCIVKSSIWVIAIKKRSWCKYGYHMVHSMISYQDSEETPDKNQELYYILCLYIQKHLKTHWMNYTEHILHCSIIMRQQTNETTINLNKRQHISTRWCFNVATSISLSQLLDSKFNSCYNCI